MYLKSIMCVVLRPLSYALPVLPITIQTTDETSEVQQKSGWLHKLDSHEEETYDIIV